ncbi:MAG: hypothetical protein HYZ63_03110 [Candidatus Andersenbacteria bacterium]|nr:hypothetical protein [Candidatus Andersenbacteria bacterium]
MRGRGNSIAFWFWTIAALLGLQAVGSRIPLVALPVLAIGATIVAYTATDAWRYILLLAVVGEMFSLLPPGIFALALFAPWLLMRVPGRPSADFSILFFLWLLLTAVSQIGILTIGLWWQALTSSAVLPWQLWWQYLPTFAPLTALGLAVWPMIAIIVWHELVAPHQVKRTVPRFKGR